MSTACSLSSLQMRSESRQEKLKKANNRSETWGLLPYIANFASIFRSTPVEVEHREDRIYGSLRAIRKAWFAPKLLGDRHEYKGSANLSTVINLRVAVIDISYVQTEKL